jgi:Protein of unknown function (DUF3303)
MVQQDWGNIMLLAGNYRFRPGSDQRVGLKRFLAWSPPAGFTFHGHWQRADGTGGVFIAEVDTVAAAFEAASAFSDLIEFELAPVIDIAESVPISGRVLEWIDSVS